MSFDTLILGALQIVIAVVLGLIIKSYLPSYFSKKGENLATKEDVKEITEKVEEIRVEYAKRQHVSEKAFDKEFEILSEVWASLFELRNAVLTLRPVFDTVDPKESEEERINKRLTEFGACFNNFAKIFVSNQPFYPKDIFFELDTIRLLTLSEANEYKYSKLAMRDIEKYWKKAEENRNKIVESIDRVGELIRQRVSPN